MLLHRGTMEAGEKKNKRFMKIIFFLSMEKWISGRKADWKRICGYYPLINALTH